MDEGQASVLIDYIEALEQRTSHEPVMIQLATECGISESELDKACRALGKIAGRDFSIT